MFGKERMEKIFEEEKELQEEIYGDGWPDQDLRRLMLHYIQRLLDETRELEVEVSTNKIHYNRVREETVDVVLMGLAISAAVFENYKDFADSVNKKLQYNKTRRDKNWRARNV